MKKQNIYNLALGIICICSLVFSLIRVVPFEVSSDTYVGVIVTLLSIIVTFVVGYQIPFNEDNVTEQMCIEVAQKAG